MPRHLTARLAWHDSGWDGRICDDPSGNIYCVGGRSLLSERLRRDRDAILEDAHSRQPLEVNLPTYSPPCYWGINAFGGQAHPIVHRHAFADLKESYKIDDALPPYTVLTWPFRISFNLDEESRNRDGKYPRELEQRINNFFAAHREGQSVVFLYLNYDNPVSGDEQRYAVVGCGLLKEKGKATRFDFSDEVLQQYRSGRGMQHFPAVNWARRLTLDPDTVVRLPYQEYVRHVQMNPSAHDKLDELAVLVTDEALIPSFKYVCDSMDDDQCLFLLHQLRRSAARVASDGIVRDYDDGAVARLDTLIAKAWSGRGAYPGLASALAYLAQMGEQSDEPKEERAQQLVETLRAQLGPDNDLVEETSKLVDPKLAIPEFLGNFRSLLRHVRSAATEDPEIVSQLLRLSQFSLSSFQMERIVSAGRSSRLGAGPFEHRSVGPRTVLDNPYALAESYVPVTTGQYTRWKEYERPLRRDAPIGVFHIDAGLFPNADYVIPGNRYDLSAAGPERIRALALQYLKERATRQSDSFARVDDIYEAIVANPLFYRSKVTVRKEVLTTQRFLDHFSHRIAHRENAGRAYFYLREVREAEELIERTVRELLKRPKHSSDVSWVDDWVNTESVGLAAEIAQFDVEAFRQERRSAISAIFGHSFSVLTGRPGSGKTHVLGKIVRTLLDSKQPVTILAPTGKAVLRLEAEAKMQARTIDKLLHEARLTDSGVAGHEDVSYEHLERIGDIHNLIIDESSMLDLPRLATLFRILHKQGLHKLQRVILVGDVNQLPPIGLGRPFEDIVSWLDLDPTRRCFHVHLETNCRQQKGGAVLEVAEIFVGRNRYYAELLDSVQRGQLVDSHLRIVQWKTEDELIDLIDERIAALITHAGIAEADKQQGLNVLFGLSEDGSVRKNYANTLQLEHFQILTPYHSRFRHAANQLNDSVHKRYKPSGSSGFAHGDKVIRLSNKYERADLLVSNGTIGVVDMRGASSPRVYFSSRPKPISIVGDEQEEYDLAYAITVHKAQGSEFDHVFVVLSSHWPLLTRELVYTALTRSKQTVTLFLEANEKPPLEIALRRSACLGRNSSIFDLPVDKYTLLEPEPGEHVDSKIEYILYSALMRARGAGRLTFEHHQELFLDTATGRKLVQPDFVIETQSGKWILEHLGMLDGQRYSERWEKKRTGYFESGWTDRLVTTDDLNGVLSETLERVIDDLCAGTVKDTPKNRFSRHHYRLGEIS